MVIGIFNDSLEVAVETKGAEIQSLRRLGGHTEYLWQGDEAFWGRRAPLLFPIVGRLEGDRYVFRGREYRLSQHGFARDMEFEVEERLPDRVSLRLRSGEATMAIYPFPFEILVRYGLEGDALAVACEVSNPGDAPLWFSVGAHPGFNCPLRSGESFEDYEAVFELEETADRLFLEDGLIAPGCERVLEGSRRLPLTRGLFERGALVFDGLRSRWAGLARRGEPPAVVVRFAGWPFLGIWTKPGAPFVCVEPWRGIADAVGFSGELPQKRGILRLEAGGVSPSEYRIEIRAQ